MKNKHNIQKIIILGASGYIGQRLIKSLKDNDNYELHLFNRNKAKLKHFNSSKNIYLYDFALIEENSFKLSQIFSDATTVFHLIHSMSEEDNVDFMAQEIALAKLIGEISVSANVKQITYLGGLGIDNGVELSTHLKSRQATGETLRSVTLHTNTSVTEFRAGVIIGAGGSSFEIIRTLATKLPFIPVFFKKEGLCEPIFVDNVINLLKRSINNTPFYNKIIEIGNGETHTYSELVQIYAKEVLNKKLFIINLSFLSFLIKPKLIGKVIAFMTGQPKKLIVPLINGVKNDAIASEKYKCENIINRNDVYYKKPIDLKLSYLLAADREDKGKVLSVWDIPDNLTNLNKKPRKFFSTQEKEGLLFEEKYIVIDKNEVEPIFKEVQQIGSKKSGYWSPFWLWKIRGYIDKFFGGPGVGNKNLINRNDLHIGDRIDFWTIENIIDNPTLKELRLIAEMKTPGKAWLQFKIVKNNDIKNSYLFYLRAYFEPQGILGYLYWYSLYIVHKFIFKTMIKKIYFNSSSQSI